MNKRFTFVLVLVLASSSLMLVKPAQSAITKPSVPQFTVKLVAHPYDVPPTATTTIDQYTGKEIVTTTPGYHVENKSIEITINNQPFAPYADAEGHHINLYYNVRFKGHFGQDWEELYPYEPIRNGEFGTYHQNPPQSSSGYTVISFPAEYPDGALVDFQVQTLEGFYTEWWPFTGVSGMAWQFTGESSDWSNTQTLTIGGSVPTATPNPSPSQSTPTPNESASPSQNPTSTPGSSDTQSGVLFGLSGEQTALAVSCVSVVVLVVAGLLVYFKKSGGKTNS
jgi:hypothetical protein